MKLVNLKEVQNILVDYKNLLLNDMSISAVEVFWYIKLIVKLSEDINSLPTYDPEKILKEMIEIEKDKLNDLNPLWKVKQIKERKSVLEKALSRITKQ